MKNYASARAGRGKTTYRSPSVWRCLKQQKIVKIKSADNKSKTYGKN
ncbi:MAG TPA: hypothetical protein P5089_00195 [Candidatus Portnoybacteria bacterium]|nr:hypothetical protein [Candidatus Portnoybacteria bacterium]